MTGTGGTPLAAALYVVAHPGDELLFMNPELQADIQAGRPVVTVYLTSSDAGDPASPWRAREESGMAAHAAMAGVTSTWTCASTPYAGKPTTVCTLTTRPGITMILLRVLDGRLPGLGVTAAVGTIDNATTYTRAELFATLAAIQTKAAPARVGTMDGTLAHGVDHVDHVAAGVLMFDVARADGQARQLTMYRAYNIYEPMFVMPPFPAAEPVNLTDAQYREKLRIVMVYQATMLDISFDEWCRRFYPIRMLTSPSASLRANGQCLQVAGNAEGAAVTLAACTAATTQKWTVASNSRVMGPGGKCLTVAPGGTAAVLTTCNSASAGQSWTLLDNGQLRGADHTCLTYTGTAVSSTTCASDTSQPRYAPPVTQRWTL